MSALFRIVYATHANGTHHKLALDALNDMQRDDGEAWTRLFLKHVERYLEGSKAPDNTFKDFKNHVLHVSENYWGGAPEKAESLVSSRPSRNCKAGNWPEAVYAAGVLSHYYSDPVMPFHTGQTEAENAIHRATEWSINRSYNALRALGEERFANLDVPVPTGERWLSQLVCDGAEFSHRYYEKLIAHYDIHKGAVRPEEGLDDIARGIVAELLIYAAKGYGHVLNAAITEAGVAAPDVTLTAETFLAMTQVPRKFIEKRLANAEDRKLVAAMYDELKATGRVDKTLTEDDRTIRDLHQREVLAPKLAERSERRAARVQAGGRRKSAANAAGGGVREAQRAGSVSGQHAARTRRREIGTHPLRCLRGAAGAAKGRAFVVAAQQDRAAIAQLPGTQSAGAKKRGQQEVPLRERRPRGGAVDRAQDGRAFRGHRHSHRRRLPRARRARNGRSAR